MAAKTTTRSTRSRKPESPIPASALAELERRLSRLRPRVSLKGWDRCPPAVVTPIPKIRGARFDVDAVVKVVKALCALRHTKGRWAGRPLIPDPWQIVWILAPVFGWKNPDGTRIVRTVWIEIPRKNGKSTISAGLGLVLLAADGEMGAEVYAAATTREQARVVFGEAHTMAGKSPALRKRVQLLRALIRAPRTGGIFRVLSKVADAAHGLNVSGAVVDEVHVHRSRELIDAIETGTGAREQPLVILITTADEGEDASIYAEKHEYVEKLSKRLVTDPTTYGVIWAAGEKDDPFDPKTWAKANPGLGRTVSVAYLRKEAGKARVTPRYLPVFCQLHLNRRGRSTERWLSIEQWDACAERTVSLEDLRGRECWAGLDLSSTQDLTSLQLVFPETIAGGTGLEVVSFFWMPGAGLPERVKRERVPYDEWAASKDLLLTEGNAVDYDAVEAKIDEVCDTYDVRALTYDRMFAGPLIQRISERVEVFPLAQTFMGLSPASKELERLVLEKRIRHGGHPVLRFNADCAEVARDANDNIRPVKPDRRKSSKRIDGMVALVMAVDGWVREEGDLVESAYERSGAETA